MPVTSSDSEALMAGSGRIASSIASATGLIDDAGVRSATGGAEKTDVYAGGESGAYRGRTSSSSLAVPFSW